MRLAWGVVPLRLPFLIIIFSYQHINKNPITTDIMLMKVLSKADLLVSQGYTCVSGCLF